MSASGLTIAFICMGKSHPTVKNYNKFVNQYWDDTPNSNSKSKIGYYFIYYFQMKYVYVHKIINILPTSERPIEMEWGEPRQILCLSDRLKEFTWEEWTTGIGFGSPYTPKYCSTQTTAWSFNELQNHVKFQKFNLQNFKKIVENEIMSIVEDTCLIKEEYDKESDVEEEESDVEEEDIDEEINTFLKQQKQKKEAFLKAEQEGTIRIMKQMTAKKLYKDIKSLQAETISVIEAENADILKQIETLQNQLAINNSEIEKINRGEKNDELIQAKVDIINLSIIKHI
jgi:hypothetical protein